MSIVAVDIRFLFYVHFEWHNLRMIDRWRLFQYFWRRGLQLVAGIFLENVLVVGDQILISAIVRSTSGTISLRIL